MLDFGANPQLQHLLSYASCFALPLTRKARFRLAGSAFAGWESNPLDRYERFQLVLTIIPPSCSPDASAIKRLRPTAYRGVGCPVGAPASSQSTITPAIAWLFFSIIIM